MGGDSVVQVRVHIRCSYFGSRFGFEFNRFRLESGSGLVCLNSDSIFVSVFVFGSGHRSSGPALGDNGRTTTAAALWWVASQWWLRAVVRWFDSWLRFKSRSVMGWVRVMSRLRFVFGSTAVKHWSTPVKPSQQ
ncbi:hypothetical protein HanIR_Chr14g0687891 [Helianthus annuus]|nr:hypothetical protein HanIR_Chr14g0687891 [Helianthus annuus]